MQACSLFTNCDHTITSHDNDVEENVCADLYCSVDGRFSDSTEYLSSNITIYTSTIVGWPNKRVELRMARWIVYAADDCLDFFYYAYLSVITAECALHNNGATQQNEFEPSRSWRCWLCGRMDIGRGWFY